MNSVFLNLGKRKKTKKINETIKIKETKFSDLFQFSKL